jgi:hypothetical protein
MRVAITPILMTSLDLLGDLRRTSNVGCNWSRNRIEVKRILAMFEVELL